MGYQTNKWLAIQKIDKTTLIIIMRINPWTSNLNTHLKSDISLKYLHARLAARAKQEGVSMNALVTAIIAESIGKREANQ